MTSGVLAGCIEVVPGCWGGVQVVKVVFRGSGFRLKG